MVRHPPRFRTAPPPDADDRDAWHTIMTDRSGSPAEQINVVPRGGYGTVCSSLPGLAKEGALVWRFTSSPNVTSFGIVDLSAIMIRQP